MEVRSYRDLLVWQRAMDLAIACYRVTEQFPKTEMYGLASQLQRAAVSIPANIAEGAGRQHRTEFVQFLTVAYGSLAELETHLELARRLHYLGDENAHQVFAQTAEVGRLVNGLLRSLRSKSPSRPPSDH